MVTHSQFVKMRLSSLKFSRAQVPWDKSAFFIFLGFNDNSVFLKCFYMFIYCSGRAFQRYVDNNNPKVVSSMSSETIFSASDFWTDYRKLGCIIFWVMDTYNNNMSLKMCTSYGKDINTCILVSLHSQIFPTKCGNTIQTPQNCKCNTIKMVLMAGQFSVRVLGVINAITFAHDKRNSWLETILNIRYRFC